jgi:hypothetical protein
MKIRVTYEIDVDFDTDTYRMGSEGSAAVPGAIEDWGDQLVEDLTDATGFLVSGLAMSGPNVEIVSY